MKKYVVRANPKGGTCHQVVMADSEEHAIEVAKSHRDGWQHATPKNESDWRFTAFERS